jgi:hypothetical protein
MALVDEIGEYPNVETSAIRYPLRKMIALCSVRFVDPHI